MQDITFKQLEAFVAVAEYRSFTRAAEELYLTQSTVSAHIQALEQTLGAALLVRGARRKPELTSEGRRVYASACDLLNRARALQTPQDAPEPGGELCLAASTVPAQYLLPGLLSEYRRLCPEARYLLRRGDSQGVHRLLEQGEARIGFAGAALDRNAFSYHAIAQDRLVLVTQASDRFRALQAQGVRGRELLSQPMLAREETSGTRQAFSAYLRRCGVDESQLNIVACMDNPETIKSSVMRGMGVSVLSQLAVREAVEAGGLLAFDLDEEGAFRKIYLVVPRAAALTPAEQKFVSFVRGWKHR